jgi:hypothetical protein
MRLFLDPLTVICHLPREPDGPSQSLAHTHVSSLRISQWHRRVCVVTGRMWPYACAADPHVLPCPIRHLIIGCGPSRNAAAPDGRWVDMKFPDGMPSGAGGRPSVNSGKKRPGTSPSAPDFG